MTKTRKLIILNLVLLLGMGSVFCLPKTKDMEASAMSMDAPLIVGDWTAGPEREAPARVRQALEAADYHMRGYVHEPTQRTAEVSMVLSTESLDQSIHRPERCLPAQGHTLLDGGKTIRVQLGDGHSLPVRRLRSEIRVAAKDGEKERRINFHSYYWFVGKHNITSSHYRRTWFDIRDRLLHGATQHWTYTLITIPVTGDEAIDGEFEPEIHKFLGEFARETISLSKINPDDIR